ncbi:O-acetylhomoserine aminocarboxypropyltransferase/cysteine synthase [Bacillus aquiflavi]|uniref:O-acetylhomoserine aminocarboxypropyltransferase/cysteine synthase n=2 Tax=Bacillus aquiflavi TaxID=2672567 RepID=A0A6B3W272_9BACI|nr:O-acetylhomoserine aminocarboxypropyltransferase/cysteine synthase family protein [Bacillus aquiflavi]MBA4538268.1 O-acetylhomoserine aminocarboxypropyltransferase/cysteine synthase [Bacillus aquiflavi]NEY82587.1 O-acetylhomoserine aminocarboxypropyltransferase/cysteine synthase [Bacillus aquiflavi]
METKFKQETIALHGGQKVDPVTRSRAVPLYQTTSYVFENTEHAASLFKMQGDGYIYSRNANPTNTVLEERLARLEGGVGAFAVSSGQAAILITVLTLAQAGEEIVATNALYGGTYTLFAKTLPRFGVTVRFVDGKNFAEVEAAMNEKTRAVFTETIGNPSLEIADIEHLSEIAHHHKIPLIVDNTFATPFLSKPIEYGADIIVHSITKFIGGHGTSIGGAIIDSGKFAWSNEKFPTFVEPNEVICNRSFVEVACEKAFITKARFELGHDFGVTLSPFNAWLFIQGLESLSVRIHKHVSNAEQVAEYLARHELVEWINYPTLPEDKQNDSAKKYLPKGAGSIFSFGIKGGLESAKTFINSVQLLSHVANVGDSKTLVIHPASTSHSRLTPEQRISSGVTPELIRLSIGLEDVEDIISDIDQALKKADQSSKIAN